MIISEGLLSIRLAKYEISSDVVSKFGISIR
jgi:hypothetical protein